MRKLALLFIAFLLFACGQKEAVEKPEKLIEESEMVNILYDLSLLQAINSHSPKSLDDSKVDVKQYIYKKYKTDSITYKQSHRYYASQLDKYEGIQKKVLEKLKAERKATDALIIKKNPLKPVAKTPTDSTKVKK